MTRPTLDGDVLNDPAWNTTNINQFWQQRPVEGSPASQKTEVFIGYTDRALYIGVICYDTNPEGIIVSDSRRDADLEDTDSFTILIDSYLDQQNGFVFGTNPAGIEYDGQVTKEGSGAFGSGGGGFNLNWDTNWQVKTQTDDFGWSAEFEFPLNHFGTAARPRRPGDLTSKGISAETTRSYSGPQLTVSMTSSALRMQDASPISKRPRNETSKLPPMPSLAAAAAI